MKNETIANMLGIIDDFNQEGGVSQPVEFITTMMFRQFMYLDQLVEGGTEEHGPTARALNEMTFSAHLLIKFIIDLLGQYERYKHFTEK